MTYAPDDPRFGQVGVFQSTPGPDGTCVEMPSSGIRTALRRCPSLDSTGVDQVICGIPFDLATSGRSAARLVPLTPLGRPRPGWPRRRSGPWEFHPFDRL